VLGEVAPSWPSTGRPAPSVSRLSPSQSSQVIASCREHTERWFSQFHSCFHQGSIRRLSVIIMAARWPASQAHAAREWAATGAARPLGIRLLCNDPAQARRIIKQRLCAGGCATTCLPASSQPRWVGSAAAAADSGLVAAGRWWALVPRMHSPGDTHGRSLGLGRSGQALFWLLLQVTASPDWRQTVGTPHRDQRSSPSRPIHQISSPLVRTPTDGE
jgi:hypothetical protein